MPSAPSSGCRCQNRRDGDGDGDGDGGDDASKAVGERGSTTGDDGDDGDGDNTARPVPRLAFFLQRCGRHPPSRHSVHLERALEGRDN